MFQESLNRNCYLTLLACISPAQADAKETLSTLRFAENVGTLKNDPKINVIINEITMARRKTPTKQAFTPHRNTIGTTAAARRPPLNQSQYTYQTLKKKSLNFPAASAVRRVAQSSMKAVANRASKANNNNTVLLKASHNKTLDFNGMQPGNGGTFVYRPTEDFSTFTGGNVSASTFVQAALNESNFSPVIRRYMSTFESKLEEKIQSAFDDMTQRLLSATGVSGTKRRAESALLLAMPLDRAEKRTSNRNGSTQCDNEG